MFLYLMRHGEAARPSPDQPPSLTPRGLSDVKKVAEHFRLGLYKVDNLWHSPLLRAKETAQAFLGVLERPDIAVEEKEWLSPDSPPEEGLPQIKAFKGSLLLVSHLPFLPNLSSLLLEREAPPFPTAGLTALEKGKGFRHLWSLDPGSLR
jgi:phosphohistidine phosphatase